MRRPPALARVVRILTAFVTVWCLGCGAYEPLFTGLSLGGSRASMVCASEDGPASSSIVSTCVETTAEQMPTVQAAALDDAAHSDFACSCQSCHSARPTATLTAVHTAAPHSVAVEEPVVPASFDRALLAPPPQRLLAKA